MIVDNKIHVLHIASGDLWAGAEVQLYTLAKTQNRRPDTQVSVIILNHGRLEQELHNCGIPVVVLDETRYNSFAILRLLTQNIRKRQPDIIHTHRNKENILGSIAALLCGNIPCCRTTHGAQEHRAAWYELHKHIIRFLDWVSGRFLQDKIIAVSNDLYEILTQEFPSNRIQVVLNGIDVDELQQYVPGQRMNKNPSLFRIGIIGRLVPVKRVDIFIRIAALLQERDPDFQASYHVYGDGPLREQLEALSIETGTEKIVRFEGHRDDIHQQLNRLDMLLMTSDHEGLPMILLEAMCIKVPIVAHSVGGIRDLLDNGKCGVLVEDHSPSAYADAIMILAMDATRRSSLVENAFQRVRQQYSAERNADDCNTLYRNILKQA